MIGRRTFLKMGFAYAASAGFTKHANAFFPLLLRGLLMRGAMRQLLMMGLRAGFSLSVFERPFEEIEFENLVLNSKNTKLIDKVGDVSLSASNHFSRQIAKNMNVQVGACTTCGTSVVANFPALPRSGSNRSARFELPDLQLIDVVTQHFGRLYVDKYSPSPRAASKVLQMVYPVAGRKDSLFDAEWNHIRPAVYKTRRGFVEMRVAGREGIVNVYVNDTREKYKIPIEFKGVDVRTGARHI